MAIQTFTSGQILTAAQMTALQAQAVMTFTTEAARDTAITAPTEGMVAYLTAPTIPTFTGGALTIYNGSVWVCISEQAATVSTFESTTSTTYTNLTTTGPAVTLVTGTAAMISLVQELTRQTDKMETCLLLFQVQQPLQQATLTAFLLVA
jgi:hypothetical protein